MVKNIDTAYDWLNMFTKASEQLYLAFIFKMPRSRAAQDRHNERRRKVKRNARKAIFSMEYIQIKYPEIYNEACNFFTVIDSKYPEKHDLRKTEEFLCFKKSPEMMKNMAFTELEPRLEIPLMSNGTRNTTVSTSEQEIPPEQEIPHSTDQITEQLQQDPLISTPQRTVTTQTIEMTIEQEIPPISINDIQSDMIDQIIEQLRQDPDLANVFNDIEQQIEFDQLGQDLELAELNLLEQEPWW